MRKNLPAMILIGLSAVLICMGVFNGEMKLIYQKAVMICLECIGIG